jgi:hypothetical protein
VAGTRISATTIQNLLEDHPWETIWLDGEQASPGCMTALAASACLEDLTLAGPRVTDETIAPLAACSSSLRRLALRQSLVTDSGLSALMALPALADLTLSGSPGITDAALGSLKQFQALKRLLVDDTGITDEGIAALTKALPNVDVWPSLWRLSLRTRYTLPLPEQIAESKLRAKIEGKP